MFVILRFSYKLTMAEYFVGKDLGFTHVQLNLHQVFGRLGN
jgi:hypothetical protein